MLFEPMKLSLLVRYFFWVEFFRYLSEGSVVLSVYNLKVNS